MATCSPKLFASFASCPARRGGRATLTMMAAPTAPILAAVRQKAPHLLAPHKAVDAVEAAARLPFAEGLRVEAKLFQECLLSDQSKALIHVFFSEREVGKVPGLPKETLPIRRAPSSAPAPWAAASRPFTPTPASRSCSRRSSQEALDRGLQTIQQNLRRVGAKGRLTQAEVDHRLALIRPTLNFDGFDDADIVVEAVFEDMALKKKVFAELDKVARPDAILATNTSTLDVDAIAAATSRPQQVIGHHFFSPANVMKLLEIVRGKQTSPAVIATSLALAKTLGKVGVLVGNCRGFVGNRMFFPYLREAQLLVEEGATVEAVDAALTDFGMAMGPFAVDDLAGLDVGWRVRQEYPHLSPPGQRAPLVADQLYELGRYGQKTGAGWYRYEGRTPVADPEVTNADRGNRAAGRHPAANAAGRGNRRAADLRPHQRRGEDPRRRHRPAGGRHRHDLRLRLRLPGVPRRADVVCRHGRSAKRCSTGCGSSSTSTARRGSRRR